MKCIANVLLGIALTLSCGAPALAVADELAPGHRLEARAPEVLDELRGQAMPPLDDGKLGRILTRYYEKGLGGAENWSNISSLKVAGRLKMADSELKLGALQKKPNLIKMTLERDQREMVLAYDGTTAWQADPAAGRKARPMDEASARRFIHSARFGSHLLYPYAEGKDLAYLDTVPLEGQICHQIRVTTTSGYQVDYFLDIRTYLEVKVENIDLENGRTNSILYHDYTREGGFPVAQRVESFENGEWVSTLLLDEITINPGIMPWMFAMPD